jgi:RNA polymerase sigma factor (sigma-70 family)
MQGEEAARESNWNRLIATFDSRIRAYLRFVPCSQDEAEEILWDVWAMAAEEEAEMMGTDPWPAIVRLIRAACRSRAGTWRHEQAGDKAAALAEPRQDTGESVVDDTDLLADVENALASLPATQRAAVDYHYRWGWPYQIVAAALDCTEVTARVHAHRGLTRLRGVIEPRSHPDA